MKNIVIFLKRNWPAVLTIFIAVNSMGIAWDHGSLEKILAGLSVFGLSFLAFNFIAQRRNLESALDHARALLTEKETQAESTALKLTEKSEAEKKLGAYTFELERSNRELQDFASVAAHDLQEPLRKIRAFGDLLEAEASDTLTREAREYIERMQASAARMQTLIDDLLAYSRVNTRPGAMVLVDLSETLFEVLADLELAVAQGGLNVENEALPVIEADPTQMRQLFQNLISNAVKFRCLNARPVLRISSTVSDGVVELIFRDNGIGFDNRYRDKIFMIFQRLHGRDQYEGNGVGLAVCRKICERHGGLIRAEGEPDKGSAFFIRFPLKQSKGRL